jgi:hypothetical protein
MLRVQRGAAAASVGAARGRKSSARGATGGGNQRDALRRRADVERAGK